MKKLSLRQKNNIVAGLWIGAVVLFGIAFIFNNMVFMLPLWIGGGLLLASAVLNFKWWRCPHCKTFLGRTLSPDFCPYCGEKIDYDAKS